MKYSFVIFLLVALACCSGSALAQSCSTFNNRDACEARRDCKWRYNQPFMEYTCFQANSLWGN